jgi:hypothetical protein
MYHLRNEEENENCHFFRLATENDYSSKYSIGVKRQSSYLLSRLSMRRCTAIVLDC